MTDPATPGVVYVLEVADRPGLVHAIAAVFAHRGLSMRSFVADTSRTPPRILVVFRGTARQSRLLERVLARLHDVHSIRVVDEDSAEVRAMAVCRPAGDWPPLAEVEVRQLGETRLISGRHGAVDRALSELAAAGLVAESFRSLVVV